MPAQQPEPNYAESVAFLKKWSPGGPWVITAIDPNKKGIKTSSFAAADPDTCRLWLEDQGDRKKRNLYFTVNTVTRMLDSKPTREHIAAMAWLHVDLDPDAPPKDADRAEIDAHYAAEQARILDLLRNPPAPIPPPTVITFSGGGYQGFWKLEKPLMLDGTPEQYEDAKRYNKQLEIVLGGDNCHNVDRIMRVPWSINRPDKGKRSKGRKEALATVVEWTGVEHSLDQFTKADPDAERANGISVAFRPPAEVRRFESVDDIPELRDAPQCRVVIVHGHDPDDPDFGNSRDQNRSGPLFFACCEMVRRGMSDEDIYSVITDPAFGVSVSVLDKGSGTERYAVRQIERARAQEEGVVLDPSDPRPSARKFLRLEAPDLLVFNGDWLDYGDGAYRAVEDGVVESRLYDFLERARRLVKDGEGSKRVPFKPSGRDVSELTRALKSLTIRAVDVFDPPCWINDPGPPPLEIISCANELLHLPTGELLPPTASFFTRNATEIEFDPTAPKPDGWIRFLGQLWPSDPDSIRALQEVVGYLLIPDTSLQKVFLLLGPPRSGKGTIARVLERLVGPRNVCAPSLPSLGNPFGLQSLIGRHIAVVSDARQGGRSDVQAAIAENLLRISGEDPISVPRKYKEDWYGKLSTRFLIMSNQRPKLPDASGALANRFVPLIMAESFLGREDPALTDRLLAELPGILNWGIEGWRRLHERGHFVLPASSRALLVQLIEDASPITAFVEDECALDPLARTPKEDLYGAWREWRLSQGLDPTDARTFGKDLQAAFPRVGDARPTIDGERVRVYTGIQLARDVEDRARDLLSAWARSPGQAFGADHERAYDKLWGGEDEYDGPRPAREPWA